MKKEIAGTIAGFCAGIIGSYVGNMLLPCLGNPVAASKVIEASEFRLVDSSGKVHGRFGFGKTEQTKSSPIIELTGGSKDTIASFGITKNPIGDGSEPAHEQASLRLATAGHGKFEASTDPDSALLTVGNPVDKNSCILTSHRKSDACEIEVTSGHSALRFNDKEGHLLWYAP